MTDGHSGPEAQARSIGATVGDGFEHLGEGFLGVGTVLNAPGKTTYATHGKGCSTVMLIGLG